MENNQSQSTPIRPEEQSHRRQFMWQILLPILGVTTAALVVTILAILYAGSASDLTAKWGMLSTVLLILPWLFLSLIPLAIIVFGIWLLKKAHHSVIPYLGAGAQFSQRTKTHSAKLTRTIATPFMQVRSVKTGIAHLLRLALHLKPSPKE